MAARIAADDVRKASLPQAPDGYKVALPADFKAPEGITFKFDDADPILPQAKAWAHAAGLTQQQFEQGLGLFAASRVANDSMIKSAASRELGKLGATATGRVDAVSRWLDANGMGVMKATMVTAAQVEAWEKHITRQASQGSGSFSQSNRDHQPQGRVSDDEYAKMSPAARLDYARGFDQTKFN